MAHTYRSPKKIAALDGSSTGDASPEGEKSAAASKGFKEVQIRVGKQVTHDKMKHMALGAALSSALGLPSGYALGRAQEAAKAHHAAKSKPAK